MAATSALKRRASVVMAGAAFLLATTSGRRLEVLIQGLLAEGAGDCK